MLFAHFLFKHKKTVSYAESKTLKSFTFDVADKVPYITVQVCIQAFQARGELPCLHKVLVRCSEEYVNNLEKGDYDYILYYF